MKALKVVVETNSEKSKYWQLREELGLPSSNSSKRSGGLKIPGTCNSTTNLSRDRFSAPVLSFG